MNLKQVTLPVRDMGQAMAFYRALGFTQIVDTPLCWREPAASALASGAARLGPFRAHLNYR